jgi:hypothetical protein
MTVRICLLGILAAASLGGRTVLAHHAFAANYDPEATGTIEGVVVEVFWSNPHVRFFVEVVNADGEKEIWDVESSPITGMAAAGWSKDTVELGDRIRVSGGLGRDGTRRLALDKASLEVLE